MSAMKDDKTNVNFEVEMTLKERLLRQADKEHRSLSNLIRHALLDYLERTEEKKDKRKKR
jgi:predicted transcriptional regulator